MMSIEDLVKDKLSKKPVKTPFDAEQDREYQQRDKTPAEDTGRSPVGRHICPANLASGCIAALGILFLVSLFCGFALGMLLSWH